MEHKFNFDNFFDLNTTDSARKKSLKKFKSYWLEHGVRTAKGNIKVPDQYLWIMQRLMSYRIDSPKSQIRLEDMEHLIIGLDEFKNYTFMFHEKRTDTWIKVGCESALADMRKHNQMVLEYRKEYVYGALRNIAFIYRVYDMKSRLTFPMYSELSGQIINSKDDAEIDHYDDDFSKVAFDCLYDWKQQWIARHHTPIVDICNVMYEHIDKKNYVFKEDAFNKSFIQFHDSHTHLRVITKGENRTREKYNPNWRILKAEGFYIEQSAIKMNADRDGAGMGSPYPVRV